MMDNPDEQHTMDTPAWSAWLDGELGPAEFATVEAHLATCPTCRQTLAEWQELRDRLAVYEPPACVPGAAQAFWRRLEPCLPAGPAEPGPDLAPCLTPLGLAVAQAVWQGAIALAGLFVLLGVPALAPAWAQIASASTWWGAALSEAGRWLGQAVPAGPAGILWPAALLLVSWWVPLVLAGLYAAWLLLWLRPGPALSRR